MLLIPAAFLVAIGVLVAVHEFGHYWVAKRLGFKVLRFSIGFGKPLLMRVGKDPDRTEYCVAAIPLGGYVKLLDEREGEVAPAELGRSFTRRPVLHRVAVLLAGPAMNLLFASLLYAILGMVGVEIVRPVIGQVRADSPAAAAGLKGGDQIVGVGDRRVDDTEELEIALIREFSGSGIVPMRVRRDGHERGVLLNVGQERRALTEPGKLLPGLGFDLAADTVVRDVPAGSAGARAGLKPGDDLLAVDGQPVANREGFVAIISASADREISIEVERAGQRQRLVGKVARVVDQGKAVGRLGITVDERAPSAAGLVEIHRLGPIDALAAGFGKTWEMSTLTVQMLWRIVDGQVSAKNISGPLSIAEFAGISAYLGVTAFLAFLAIISVSLGVLNLMPVPLLDGGQVVYQLVEAVKGSPLSERAQLFGQQVGIALLLLLMSLAFYNDISRHFN
ncbi:MAG TPA: RIP metalloprotease RseP [Steroidobacteraceae bacterium]|jgi:regulator of sigma E protease|nr:RIP metalloprotease RseP [Steroidobacteraceae bacterium]